MGKAEAATCDKTFLALRIAGEMEELGRFLSRSPHEFGGMG